MTSPTYIWTEVGEESVNVTDTFLLAGWFQIPPFDGSLQVFAAMSDSEGVFEIDLSFSGGIVFVDVMIRETRFGDMVVDEGTDYLDDPPNHPYIQGGWNSFALSGRFSSQTMQYMINRQLLDPNVNWHTTGPVTFVAGTEWAVGAGRAYPGFALSDWRFSYGEPFFDLSNPGNVARLFGGGPVDWGPAGEFVTGLIPKVFLHGDAATYMDNPGSLGKFTRGDTLLLLDTPGPGYGTSGRSITAPAETVVSSEGMVVVTTVGKT
jgi:hypothetical protein